MTVSISDSQLNRIEFSFYCYAVCQYAGSRYAEYRCAECSSYSECLGATKSYVELDTDPGTSIYTKGLTG